MKFFRFIELFSRYGLFGMLGLAVNVVRGKAVFRNARIIRFPFDVRGKRHMRVADGFTTGHGCRMEVIPQALDAGVCIEIGQNFQMNDFCHIAATEMVSIGNDVLCASKVFITDLNHGSYAGNDKDSDPSTPPSGRMLSGKQVVIGDNVWLGECVSVLPGARIGSGSIIGAHSVVAGIIPENCIAVGIPARVIKMFDKETGRWRRVTAG